MNLANSDHRVSYPAALKAKIQEVKKIADVIQVNSFGVMPSEWTIEFSRTADNTANALAALEKNLRQVEQIAKHFDAQKDRSVHISEESSNDLVEYIRNNLYQLRKDYDDTLEVFRDTFTKWTDEKLLERKKISDAAHKTCEKAEIPDSNVDDEKSLKELVQETWKCSDSEALYRTSMINLHLKEEPSATSAITFEDISEPKQKSTQKSTQKVQTTFRICPTLLSDSKNIWVRKGLISPMRIGEIHTSLTSKRCEPSFYGRGISYSLTWHETWAC